MFSVATLSDVPRANASTADCWTMRLTFYNVERAGLLDFFGHRLPAPWLTALRRTSRWRSSNAKVPKEGIWAWIKV